MQETAAAAGLCAEVVASGRCFFELLHVLRLKLKVAHDMTIQMMLIKLLDTNNFAQIHRLICEKAQQEVDTVSRFL